MNRSVRVVVSIVMLVGTVLLLISTYSLIGKEVRIFEQNQLATNLDNMTTVRRRRYSTSDEMLYILYGVGDQYSPYDEQLIEHIRSLISQPSLTRPRQIATTQKKDRSERGQSTFVDKLLSGRRGGFFIECGAADGEKISTSLFFETERNWTGLLIEANPAQHRSLLEKNRRAYVLQACLSTGPRPATVHLLSFGLQSGIVDKMFRSQFASIDASTKPTVAVQCFPLNAVTAALGISHVDYLSLDVEGPELEILQAVDWTRLHIDVITIEYKVPGRKNKPATLKKLRDLRHFFRVAGIYREVALMPNGSEADGIDVVFARV